jgi:hypothetical protein
MKRYRAVAYFALFFPLSPVSAAPPDAAPPHNAETKLPWETGHPERADWSRELRQQLSAKLSSFESAEDIAAYCPSYSTLTAAQKVDVLATIAVRIAKFESSYNPKQHFHEPPPLDYDSVGLFQLSYEDGFSWCSLDLTKKSLEDPLNNIRCAVPEMARLVANDKLIAAGTNAKNARGLARYWSVVREGPKHHLDEVRKAASSLKICS